MKNESQTTKIEIVRWKPIRTFPKSRLSGTSVLVYCPRNRCQFTAVYTPVGHGKGMKMAWVFWASGKHDEVKIPWTISHWKELDDGPTD